MGAWQIFMIAFMSIELLLLAHLHGKPRKDNHNFWNGVLGWGVFLLFLIQGGFFK